MQDIIHQILKEIKKKPELKNADESSLLAQIQKQIKKNYKLRKKLESIDAKHLLKAKEVKELIKIIRAQARLSYGMFKTAQSKNYKKVLQQLQECLQKNNNMQSEESLRLHNKLLETHRSTKERINSYEFLYQDIFNKTITPKTILDLGCGLNPLSWIYMNIKDMTYHAREWSQEDVKELKAYYDITKLKGSVEQADLTKEQDYPEADLCFLFKTIDVIEHEKRGITKHLLNTIKAQWIIVSFATQTLGGKPMKTKRAWFENLIEELGFEVKVFEITNEIFYCLKKRTK